MNETPTVKLGNGWQVLAKPYKRELSAVTYANRTQAEARAAKLGAEWWVVCQSPASRVFYIARIQPSLNVDLPPVPEGKIKFNVIDREGARRGHVYADNAVQAAEKLHGRMTQSAPGWGRVECEGGELFLAWRVR